MSSEWENFVTKTRSSIIGQLNSANSLYDIVNDLTDTAEDIPPEYLALKTRLQEEAIKLYKEASNISDNASAIGKELANLVSK